MLISFIPKAQFMQNAIYGKDGLIVDALIGSANFSRNGLATPDREVLVEADSSVYGQLQDYYDKNFKKFNPLQFNHC